MTSPPALNSIKFSFNKSLPAMQSVRVTMHKLIDFTIESIRGAIKVIAYIQEAFARCARSHLVFWAILISSSTVLYPARKSSLNWGKAPVRIAWRISSINRRMNRRL